VAAGQSHVAAVPAAEQRLLNALLAPGRVLAGLAGIPDIVVDALGNEDQVGKAEVDGEGGDGGDEAGPEGAGKVRDVANEPDGEEGERDAVGRGLLVVFDKLGHQQEDPRGQRDGAEDARQSLMEGQRGRVRQESSQVHGCGVCRLAIGGRGDW